MSVYLAKGTRDHLPEKMNQRLYVIAILREVFERYGFEPLETPAFERIERLLPQIVERPLSPDRCNKLAVDAWLGCSSRAHGGARKSLGP